MSHYPEGPLLQSLIKFINTYFQHLDRIKWLKTKHTPIDLTIESNEVIINQLNCNYAPIKGHASGVRTRDHPPHDYWP